MVTKNKEDWAMPETSMERLNKSRGSSTKRLKKNYKKEVQEMNERIAELEELCEVTTHRYELEKDKYNKLEVQLTKVQIEKGQVQKMVTKLKQKNESKDLLIKEFEDLISQLTDQIEQDKEQIKRVNFLNQSLR